MGVGRGGGALRGAGGCRGAELFGRRGVSLGRVVLCEVGDVVVKWGDKFSNVY